MQCVLIVEDLPDEQRAAKDAVVSAELTPVVAATFDDAMRIWRSLGDAIVGVITDLHFPEMPESPERVSGQTSGDDRTDPGKPCGLAIVAESVRRNLPVVICSNIDHHRCDWLRVVIVALGSHHVHGPIPFLMDRKNWPKAVGQLQDILARKEES